MAVQLFSHNMQAYGAVKQMLGETSKAAVVHPTGTGKSFIAFKWVEENPEMRFLWLSPSDYIYLTQAENVQRVAPDFSLEGVRFLSYARLMMMTGEELASLAPDGIVLDEFHRCGAKCWGVGVQRLLRAYPQAKLLGLTATKIRYLDDQRDMAEELFEGCVASEMTLGEAIVRGILPTPTYVTALYQAEWELGRLEKRVEAVNLAALRRQSRRHMDDLRRAVEKADGLKAVFEKRLTNPHGKYLVFCAGHAHMRSMQSHAREWFGGIDPEPHCYCAYSADPETSRAYRAFVKDESEHLKLLFSINMLNEGVHVQGVSGVILFRPTVSPIIYKQQIGRALTAGTQRTPLILDVVNNFEGLSSYGSLHAEMEEAVGRLRREHRDDEVVVEKLAVHEEMKDAVALFRRLEASLSSTWDTYYDAACLYHKTHGHLRVPVRYTDANGLCLGLWVRRQREAYDREKYLTQGQVQRLNAIGMVWESSREQSWRAGYEHAKAFAEQHGHLDVENAYVCEDGYALGAWIRRMRQQRNGSMASTVLTAERAAQLDAMGMVWSVYDASWQRGYEEAKRFYEANGHLDVPGNYTAESGFALGHWISAQRQAKSGAYGRKALIEEQTAALDALGMLWETRKERQWRVFLEAAKAYYRQNGNLKVPQRYETPEGVKLGSWVHNQRRAWKLDRCGDGELYRQLEDMGLFGGKNTG